MRKFFKYWYRGWKLANAEAWATEQGYTVVKVSFVAGTEYVTMINGSVRRLGRPAESTAAKLIRRRK